MAFHPWSTETGLCAVKCQNKETPHAPNINPSLNLNSINTNQLPKPLAHHRLSCPGAGGPPAGNPGGGNECCPGGGTGIPGIPAKFGGGKPGPPGAPGGGKGRPPGGGKGRPLGGMGGIPLGPGGKGGMEGMPRPPGGARYWD